MTEQALDVEVALLAAEADYIAELIDRGILPPGARREPTSRELRAGVRFAELDRLVVQTAALVMRDLEPVRALLLDELGPMLAGMIPADASPYDVVETLTALDTAQVPDLMDTLEEAVEAGAAQLEQVAQAGADEALSEASRQGIPTNRLPDVDAVTDEARAAAAAHSSRAATAHIDRVLAAATEGAARAATLPGATVASTVDAAIAAGRESSIAAVEDLARQGANVTHGIGRREAQAAMPEPAEVYASELLDRNTCGPCADLDGTEYATLEEGFADYPGAGGYIDCDGGSRCRGTLVIVWPQEAGPTTRAPGFGPKGGQLPR